MYLSPIISPAATPGAPTPRHVYAVDNDAGPLSIADSRIQVRIFQSSAAVIAIDAVGNHQDFPPRVALRPALDEIAETNIWITIDACHSHWQAQSFPCRRVIGGQLLLHLGNAVLHVGYADLREAWLGIDEPVDLFKL